MNKITLNLSFSTFFFSFFISLSCLLCPLEFLNGQNKADFQVLHWDNSSGLPVNSLSDGLISSSGFLYLSTFDGLVRFDGNRFTTFRNTLDSPDLGNRFVQLFEYAPESFLILTTENRVLHFEHGAFKKVEPAFPLIYHVFWDKGEKRFYLGTENGIWSYDPFTKVGIQVFKELISTKVEHLVRDKSGTIWLVTDEDEFKRVRKNTLEFLSKSEHSLALPVYVSNPSGEWVAFGSKIFEIRNDSYQLVASLKDSTLEITYIIDSSFDSKLLFSTYSQGLWSYDYITRTVQKVTETNHSDDYIFSSFPFYNNIIELGKNQLWRSTEYELLFNDTPFFSTNSSIRKIIPDNNNNPWVLTSGAGLFHLKTSPISMMATSDEISNANYYAVYQSRDSSLWLGTHGNFFYELRPDGTIDPYLDAISDFTKKRLGAFPRTFLEMEDALLIGTLDGGLLSINRSTRTLSRISIQNIAPISVFAIEETLDGSIYLGTSNGLFVKPPKSSWEEIERIALPSSKKVVNITELPNRDLMVSTIGDGIYQIRRGSFNHVTASDGLSSNRVRDLLPDPEFPNSRFWVITQNNGLNRVDFDEMNESWNITPIAEQDGLYTNSLHNIELDDYGNFWIGTNFGLLRIKRSILNAFCDRSISYVSQVLYDDRNGLKNRELNGGTSPSSKVLLDKRIAFVSQDGIVVVDPSKKITGRHVQPYIEYLSTPDTTYYNLQNKIYLDKGRSNIQIQPTILPIAEQHLYSIRYRLNELDSKWTHQKEPSLIQYSGIPAGKYTFDLEVLSTSGRWIGLGSTVEIDVHEPFWESTVFYTIVYSLLLVLVSLLVFQRTRLRSRQNELILEKKLALQKAEQLKLEEKQRSFDEIQALNETNKSKLIATIHQYQQPLDGVTDSYKSVLDTKLSHLDTKTYNILRNVYGQLARTQLRSLLSNIALGMKPENSDKMETTNLNDLLFDYVDIYRFELNKYSTAINTNTEGYVYEVGILHSSAHYFFVALFDLIHSVQVEYPKSFELRFQFIDKGKNQLTVSCHFPFQIDSNLFVTPNDFAILQSLLKDAQCTLEWSHTPTTSLSLTTTYLSKRREIEFTETSITRIKSLGERLKLLIVEDDPITRTLISSYTQQNFNIQIAENGNEGYEKALFWNPDIIISDYMMPIMTGEEMVRKLRTVANRSQTVCIIITSRIDPSTHERCMHAGADALLSKPFNTAELMSTIRRLIEARHSSIESKESNGASKNSDAMYTRFLNIIDREYSNPDINVNDIAKMLGVDRSQLYRKTKQLSGKSPIAILQAFRLEQSCRLLEQGSETITEIALACGFNSLSYFSKAFKEEYGKTPSEYLEQSKQNQLNDSSTF